ncbi:MAG: Major outer membrane porin [Candidatus Anoxychlamydiales bacterium]|nr:Major outer membrane porin [Candidatus Anoxychlamydiales bacterium]
MKKIYLILFIFLFSKVISAPVGNPFNPTLIEQGFFISPSSIVNFRVGYEGNFVNDSKFKKSLNEKSKIDDFEQDINSGTFTLNFQNRLDVLTSLGASRIKSNWRFDESDVSKRIELETNYRFYYALAARVILFEWGNTALGAGGRFSKTKPSIFWLLKDGTPQDENEADINYKDWQIDLGLSHKIDIFVPYIGIKYLDAKAKIMNVNTIISENDLNFIKMKSRNKFGLYLGTSLSNSKYFLLTIEARLIDEEAISIFGELKF